MICTREEVVAMCLQFPFAYEDYPFDDTNWTVLRHQENKKMFAAVFERKGYIWVNVKADPMWADLWRRTWSAVLPAYHMNKLHWISIILDGSVPDEEILRLIGDSFRLTSPERGKRKRSQA